MEKSAFWTTNGTGDGTLSGYTATEFYDFVRRLTITDQEATQGVLKGVLNELAVTGSATPLAVASGAAICYGFYYENSASLNLTVTTPTTGTTGGRVNLKVDWTAQTVRAVIQMNTDGVAAIPALVQTGGSEWNVPLATFTVTTSGVIALTDARTFCQFANYLTAASFEDVTGLSVIGRASNTTGASAAITAGSDGQVLLRNGTALEFGQVAAAGITDNAVTDAKLRQSAGLSVIGRSANSTGNVADITAGTDGHILRRSGTAIGFGTITADALASGSVATAKIADNAIDDTKAGDRVAQFYRRKGGSDTDWSSAGTTTYTPGAVRMQGGVSSVTLGVGVSTNTVTVTFPTAFSYPPIMLNTIRWNTGMNPDTTVYTPFIDSVSATQVVLRVTRNSTADGSVTPIIQWLATGPE